MIMAVKEIANGTQTEVSGRDERNYFAAKLLP
jgi:hypothetical protein